MDSEKSRAILARAIVKGGEPAEMEIFDEIAEALSAPVRHSRGHPLGSGIGESWIMAQLVTPFAFGVAGWLLKDVLGKAGAEAVVPRLKNALDGLLADSRPQQGPDGLANPVTAEERRCIDSIAEQGARKSAEQGASPEQQERVRNGIRTALLRSLER